MEIKTGYLHEDLAPEDYIFGGVSKLDAEILQPLGNWGEFLPVPESQIRKIDTYNCTGEGTSNALEVLLKRKFGGEWNFSDRALGIVADTSPPGNSPKRVADTIRNKPCMVPENFLPFDDSITSIEQYYSPKPLIFPLTRMAKEFFDTYEVGYEDVPATKEAMREALKISPLCISVFAWVDENGIYYKPPGAEDTHWSLLYSMDARYNVFDSYPPFLKVLREDFTFQKVMRYSIKKRPKRTYWWFDIWNRLTT